MRPRPTSSRARASRASRAVSGRLKVPVRLDLAGALLLVIGGCTAPAGSAPPSAERDGGTGASAVASPSAAAASPSPAPLEFEPITLVGQGDRRVAFDLPEAAAALAKVEGSGVGPFRVQAVSGDGSPGELLVDAAGDYAGLVLFDALVGEHSVAFEVTSNGAWTIVVEPVGLAPSWSGDIPLSGSGDDVALLDAPSDGTTAVRIEHPGQGPVRVLAYTSAGELDQLVATSGGVDEIRGVPRGTICIEVRAVGRWTLSPG